MNHTVHAAQTMCIPRKVKSLPSMTIKLKSVLSHQDKTWAHIPDGP